MITRLKTYLFKHIFFILYIFSMLMLVPGLVGSTGTQHVGKLITHVISFLVFFGLSFSFLAPLFDRWVNVLREKLALGAPLLSNLLFYGIMSSILFFFLYFGYFPFFKQLTQTDTLEAALVRQNLYNNLPPLLGYALSFLVKGLIPFGLLLLLYLKEYKKLVILLLVSVFFLFNLLQKNFILFALMPSLLYLLLNKKIWLSGGYLLIVISFIYTLVYTSNPELRGYSSKEQIEAEIKGTRPGGLSLATNGLYDRLFFVPGRVVAIWFEAIPAHYPFLNGRGYNFYAKLTGQEYVDYSKQLYKEYYPQYAKQGLQGTVNTAGFVVDYSNFGYIGLCFSGLIIGFWFVVIGTVFKNRKILVALNFMNVMLLNSGYITTLCFSGGWALTIVLYLFSSSIFEPVCAESAE